MEDTAFVLLLVAAGFLLRLWGLSKMHFWDENVYLQNAEVLCCGKTNYSEWDSRPPLLSLLFAGVFLVWHHIYAASIATALLNALGGAWLYLSGRMIAGRVAAAIAALLFEFAPFFVGVFQVGPKDFVVNHAGHSLLADAPALSLIVLSFWLLLRALERQTDLRFAAAGFALALSVLMRFGSLSSVGVLALLVLAAKREVRAALACAAGFAAGIGPYLIWSRLRYGAFFETMHNGWENFDGPRESPFVYVKLYDVIFTWLSLAGLALWAGRWAWDRWTRRHRLDDPPARRSRWLQGFLCAWGIAVLVFFSTLRHAEPRYIMPLAPPLFLLAGIGLSTLVRVPAARLRAAGSVVLALAMLGTFLPLRHRFDAGFIDPAQSEEMQVADYLNKHVPPGTALYANYNYPDYGYYTNLPIAVLPDGGVDLYKELEAPPADGVLIAYKRYADDETPQPSVAWVDAHPRFRRLREFPSVVLYEVKSGAANMQAAR